MAIERLGVVGTGSSSSGTTCAVNMPSNAPAGALGIIVFAANLNTTVTQPSGWATYDPILDGALVYRMVTRILDGSEGSTVTFSLNSAGDWAAVAGVYGGVVNATQGGAGYGGAWNIAVQDYTPGNPEAGTDTTHTCNQRANSHRGAWHVIMPALKSTTTGGWSGITSNIGGVTCTEQADVASSGSDVVQVAMYDTGPVADDYSAATFTATSVASASDKVMGTFLLRPAGGVQRKGSTGTVASGSAGSTVALPYPTNGIPAQSLLLAAVSNAGGATVTAPAGWTKLQETADGSCTLTILGKYATGTESGNLSITLSGSVDYAGIMTCYDGVQISDDLSVSPTTPLEASAIDTESSTDTTIVSTSLTATHPDSWRIGFYALATTGTDSYTFTATSGRNPLARSTVISSGTTKVRLQHADSNGTVPSAAGTVTATSASLSDKVIWTAVLRPSNIWKPTQNQVSQASINRASRW